MNYFERAQLSNEGSEETLHLISAALEREYVRRDNDSEKNTIRLHESTLGKEELLAFIDCYLKGNITMGEKNDEYEATASSYFDARYCLSNNSGSSANLLAISGLVESGKLRVGDKVIVPALSWSTTVFPLIQNGLIPVFVDQNCKDYNIDTKKIENCGREVEGIKAIMLIHTYGIPADIEKIINLALDNHWLVIEDTCESMGAEYKGKKVGGFGDIGTFSTYYSHHLCTLEGGLAITNDKELASIMKSIRSHGWIRHLDDKENIAKLAGKSDPDFTFQYTGYNLRMTEPQAAMGIEQFKKLNQFVKQRQKNAVSFIDKLEVIKKEQIRIPRVDDEKKASWFGMPVIINNCNNARLVNIRKILKENLIESRPFLAGNFQTQPVMRRHEHIKYESLVNAEMLEQKALALPCHQSLNENDMHRVAEVLVEALEKSK